VKDKRPFVRALAELLAADAMKKSIMLEASARVPSAMWVSLIKEWAAVREQSPLFGYPSVDEAEKQLAEFLEIGS
jgi:hypothetical protein